MSRVGLYLPDALRSSFLRTSAARLRRSKRLLLDIQTAPEGASWGALGSLGVTTLHDSQQRERSSAVSFATAPSGTFAVIVAVVCVVLLISNIAGSKTITVVDGLPEFLGGGIFTDGGAFLFPLTYIVGDVLAEVYGLRQAKRAIWVGFALGALASLTFLAVGAAPPGPGYENQEAFVAVLGLVPWIVLASLAG